MERPVFYGRYSYGEEIIHTNDLQPLNQINTQYSRTEASANTSQPTDLFRLGYRSINRKAISGSYDADRANHYNDDGGYYAAGPSSALNTRNHHGYGNSQPVNSFTSRHSDFNLQAIQGGLDTSRANQYNNDGGYYAAGPSSASNTRNHHGYGNSQPVNSFASRHSDFNLQALQGGLDAGRANDGGYYAAGPSSASNTWNHHYGNSQPVDSFASRHRDFNLQAMQGSLDASRPNLYNDDAGYYQAGPSSASNTRNHRGYSNPEPGNSFASRHRDFNLQTVGGANQYNNDDGYYAAGPSFASNNWNHHGNPEPLVNSIGSRHRDFNERNIGRVYNNVTTNEVDLTSLTNTERAKLINRVTKYFRVHVPLIYAKNIDLFDKGDWVKVSFTHCNGMKIFQADMVCPICLGNLTPQNKEKEAGRIPKWDLGVVKRHVINVHLHEKKIEKKENDDGTEPVVKKENVGKVEPAEETNDLFGKEEKDDEKVELLKVENKPEDIEKVELLEVGNKPSEKKDEPLDELGVEEVEKSSDTSDFVSYFSLAASASSDSETHSESESEIDTKKDKQRASEKGTRKPKMKFERKQNFAKAESKQQSSEGNSVGTGSKRSKRNSDRTRSKLLNLAGTGSKKRSSERKYSRNGRKIKIPSSSSESERETPDWQKPGVSFGWVKLTTYSRFQPAFIFPKLKNEEKFRAQYIQAKGSLSDFIHPVESIATSEELELAKKSKKSSTHLSAIKKFNALNNTNF